MKLYATTTSERASKGQGGNEYIRIVLKDEKQIAQYEIIWTIDFLEVKGAYDNDYLLRIPQNIKTKGKRQKGDTMECQQCGETIPIHYDMKGQIIPEYCPFCR